ncbi:putative cell wall-binding protein [Microbacteriaceae bacterium SG_E_30_P1]|uniref:Cell wall-binding protein n=1 Tax=Antiquaquibacter oligotrophicus TaxID=2880260 RepID=A0ABT6KK09_9MICO|nr:cell wall-binding repeat-containing protein [Antiquaquibacter oligotrophicus]MDH6180025.1 putative cell wall-binding protein [Antiquaquibacter oligotrophicus]UDF14221.1 cell wall-binding repeat-containing protein [Antiquaquibacter oligotrophicus]
MTPPVQRHTKRSWRLRAKVAAALALSGSLLFAGVVPSATADVAQAPGIILRGFNMGQSIGGLCELTPGQTPNVDKVMTNVDWQSDAQFGLTDFFIAHALGNITIPTTGNYTFRLTADDSGRLSIGGETIIANANGGGTQGTATLEAGLHTILVEHYEDYWGQNLKLEWMKPGDGNFSVVPASAYSYDDETMAHVTAPGIKTCVGTEDSPGDGLPLDDVNPMYDLIDLRADAWEPQVTGLAWLGEQLIVSTWGGTNYAGNEGGHGQVYLLDGVVGDDVDAEEVTRTLIADNLNEPMGVTAVDGKVYVTEKHQLLELTDDSDGTWAERTVAAFPYGGNYHEFAFGLLYDEGYFYLNLSVGIGGGGSSSNPQPADNRGTHVKVNAATGEVEYVAGGLRTPNGMTWTSDGTILVADNQGDWLPASKLIEIEEGGFYNHYNTPSGPFDNEDVVRPIVWFPQNEIGNSTSQPVELTDGPFAGQLLVGDVTYGGLQRVSTQVVDDVKQGVVFRHTQGLESGINRTILGPDGDIYFGGLGAGGNWGQANKLRYGLQKLSPNGDDNFDMHNVTITESGFEITYTKPISEETLATIEDAYAVEQWRYAPVNAYGGPKLNHVDLTPSNVVVSEDKKTVSFDVEGLREDRVAYIHSPRPFSSVDGDTLWSTEAWYTINEIPGYVPPPVVPTAIFEMEDGTQSGSAGVATEHAGYTGTGFIDNFFTGSTASVEVTVNKGGVYQLATRYAAGPHPDTNGRTASLFVNDEAMGQQAFPNTLAWNAWSDSTTEVTLSAGTNVIEYRAMGADTGYINFDNVALTLLEAEVITVEAETGQLSGGADIDTEHAGFSGDAFVDGFDIPTAAVDIPVTVPTAGEYDVTLRYGAGQYGQNPDSRTTHVTINEGTATQLTLGTASAWSTWLDSEPFRVTLAAGENIIRFHNVQGDTGFINLDRIQLVAADVDPDPDPDPEPVAQTFYQWELGTKTNAQNANAFGGSTGTGYVNGLDANSSVSLDILVEEAGEYDLAFRYANGASMSSAPATGSVYINDTEAGDIAFPSTVANWAKWATERITVELEEGVNTVEYRVEAGDTGSVNLDLLSVRPHGEPIALFDGNGLANWQNTNGSAANWVLEDDTMRVSGGNIRTLEGFRDFRLDLDFWLPVLPPEVTGQDRANSGVYLQERYEMQVLDSFGIDPLQTNDAGSIYLQKAPDVNAAAEPGTWQNYVIEFTAARWEGATKVSNPRVTAWWNGQKIHDNIEVFGSTTLGEQEGPATGGIMLQDHSNPVKYRDISLEFIEPAVAPEPEPSLVYEAEQGVRSGGAGVATEHSGYSGTGFVDLLLAPGDGVRLNLFVADEGEYNATLRYAAGPYGSNPTTRTVSVRVNDGDPVQIELPTTSAWNVWSDFLHTLDLNEGANTVEYYVAPGDTGFINPDLLTLELVGGEEPTEVVVDRVAGATRYDVAVNISHGAYPDTAPVVYVANGENYPDALSAGPAAAHEGGPLLLVQPNAVPSAVADEIARLDPAKIVVVGGVNSVSAQTFTALSSMADEAVRIAGADRYEVSRNVAEYAFGDTVPLVYVATGEKFPDALAAGGAAGSKDAPVILVRGSATALDDATTALLESLGTTSTRVLGGPATVTPALFDGINSIAEATRLGGADRYEAARAINMDAFDEADRAFIATGLNFPDALAGSAWAAAQGAPMYVVPGSCVTAGVLADLDALGVTNVTLLGGENSLSPEVFALTAC